MNPYEYNVHVCTIYSSVTSIYNVIYNLFLTKYNIKIIHFFVKMDYSTGRLFVITNETNNENSLSHNVFPS